MEDETDSLSNWCADLVSLRRFEPGLLHLFRERSPGEWVQVSDLYARAGEPPAPVPGGLVAAWLPSPTDAGYAIVVFWDEETRWSLTAEYDVARLLNQHPRSMHASG